MATGITLVPAIALKFLQALLMCTIPHPPSQDLLRSITANSMGRPLETGLGHGVEVTVTSIMSIQMEGQSGLNSKSEAPGADEDTQK
jgi:hypothetical protein